MRTTPSFASQTSKLLFGQPGFYTGNLMKEESLNIVHIVHVAGASSFGLGQVALNLIREQNILGSNADLWTLDSEADRQWAAASFGVSTDKIRRFRTSRPGALFWSREMELAAHKQAAQISVVHQHSLWNGLSRIPPMLRAMHGVPAVITPHGTLEKWALRKSRWKKKIAMALYESSNLRECSCLHACSEQEIAGFRDFGLTNPIAVIPNGISYDWLQSTGRAEDFRKRFDLPPGKRIMLFLSRITPVKGLPMFMEAVKLAQHSLDDWIIVIAGSDEFDHKKEVQEKIEQLHLAKKVYFVGLLFDQVKRDAFEAAELFLLPSKRENYGIVVAEALGAGVPVLTTKGAPWEILLTHQCGWWADVSPVAIAEALKDALNSAPDDLRRMGQRGKNLVASSHTWPASARMTIELYEWLLNRRERPDFVVVD